jgi:hypothetical protein
MFVFYARPGLTILAPFGGDKWDGITCTTIIPVCRGLHFKKGYFYPPASAKYRMTVHQADMYMFWINGLDMYPLRRDSLGIRIGPFTLTNDGILYESTLIKPCDQFSMREANTIVTAEGIMPIYSFIAVSLAIGGADLEY